MVTHLKKSQRANFSQSTAVHAISAKFNKSMRKRPSCHSWTKRWSSMKMIISQVTIIYTEDHSHGCLSDCTSTSQRYEYLTSLSFRKDELSFMCILWHLAKCQFHTKFRRWAYTRYDSKWPPKWEIREMSRSWRKKLNELLLTSTIKSDLSQPHLKESP